MIIPNVHLILLSLIISPTHRHFLPHENSKQSTDVFMRPFHVVEFNPILLLGISSLTNMSNQWYGMRMFFSQ